MNCDMELHEFGTFFLKKIEIIKENLDKFQVQEPRLVPVAPKENPLQNDFLAFCQYLDISRIFQKFPAFF